MSISAGRSDREKALNTRAPTVARLLVAGALLCCGNAALIAPWTTVLLIPIAYHLTYFFMVAPYWRRLPSCTAPGGRRLPSEVVVPVVVAIRDEAPGLLKRTLFSIQELHSTIVPMCVIDDGSADETAAEYSALESANCRVRRCPRSQRRQFGAQAFGAGMIHTEYVAIVDADSMTIAPWLQKAEVALKENDAAAIGFRQAYEDDGRAVTRWANAILCFEHCAENRYRVTANAHTISGAAIVVIRSLFLEYHNSVSRAHYTEDFGFALWLHARKLKILVDESEVIHGRSPTAIGDLAQQQARWCDDILLYLRAACAGGLGGRPARHWHFLFHASKHAYGVWCLLGGCAMGLAHSSLLVGVVAFLAFTWCQCAVFQMSGRIRYEDWVFALAMNIAVTASLCFRLLRLPASGFRDAPTRKSWPPSSGCCGGHSGGLPQPPSIAEV